jgi:hypothetical protein
MGFRTFLLEINVGHNLVLNDNNLERVDIYKKIYFDGLNKDRFMDTIFALQRGTNLVELMFR